MNRRLRMSLALLGIVALGALGACSDDDGDVAAPEGPHLTVTDTDAGEILVDHEGRTVYLFTEDSPGQSACVDEDCLSAWPILEGEFEAGEGVDADLLGTIERDDGMTQATYGDWPLYYFASDEGPGDIQGQGVNDVWFVLDPAGNAIEGDVAVEEDGNSGY
ncbi:COG4315 family predicted lipoprotein [Phytoactinopolyspora halophila]|nr:hypothetical protein [Phytoactinopolyspora halophila]